MSVVIFLIIAQVPLYEDPGMA